MTTVISRAIQGRSQRLTACDQNCSEGGEQQRRKLPLRAARRVDGEIPGCAVALREQLGGQSEGQQEEEERERAVFPDEEKSEREQDVKVLLDGECPEVACDQVGAVGMVEEIDVEKEGGYPGADGVCVGVVMGEAEGGEQGYGGQEGELGGLDAEDSADVEAADVEVSDEGFFFQDAGGDEKTADGEEEVEAVSAVTHDEGQGVAEKRPGAVMGHHDADDGDGAPAIEGGEIAGFSGPDGDALGLGHKNKATGQATRRNTMLFCRSGFILLPGDALRSLFHAG